MTSLLRRVKRSPPGRERDNLEHLSQMFDRVDGDPASGGSGRRGNGCDSHKALEESDILWLWILLHGGDCPAIRESMMVRDGIREPLIFYHLSTKLSVHWPPPMLMFVEGIELREESQSDIVVTQKLGSPFKKSRMR